MYQNGRTCYQRYLSVTNDHIERTMALTKNTKKGELAAVNAHGVAEHGKKFLNAQKAMMRTRQAGVVFLPIRSSNFEAIPYKLKLS